MDVTYRITSAVLHGDPFRDHWVRRAIKDDNECPNTSERRWNNSSVNPINLPNSLDTDGPVQWKITGSHIDDGYIQIYALPISLIENGPLPVANVLIKIQGPKWWDSHRGLDWVLQLYDAYAPAVMGPEINQLLISKYVLRTLSRWASTFDDFDDYYRQLPYGTIIEIDSCSRGLNVNRPHIKVVRPPKMSSRYHRHRQATPRILPEDSPFDQPPVIRLDELAAVSQLHDTVTLVTLPNLTGKKLWVFKTTKLTKLRLEAKNVSLLAELTGGRDNPRLMGLPAYCVVRSVPATDTSPFGMIFEYQRKGTLAAVIDQRRVVGPPIDLATKFKWAQQLIDAVMQLTSSKMAYHSSLKPNNILVNDDDTLRVIDMEQGGNWITFAAPEVAYHRASWSGMDAYEREKAEVFSLGKILWCIFEGWSHTKNTDDEVWSVALPVDHEFPNFNQTPEPEVKDLILECVAGAMELEEGWRWDYDIVVVDGVQFPRGQTGQNGDRKATASETIRHAQRVYEFKWQVVASHRRAKDNWDEERRVEGVASSSSGGAVPFSIDARPRLQELAARLRELERKLCA